MLKSADNSRYVQRENVRLHYVVAGRGPTLIFIHGIPDFWNGWRYQIAHFRNEFQVVSVDLRGVNLSDKPPAVSSYQIVELVRDVAAVLDDLGVGRATIIGHDWGAIISWWTAILAPWRVDKIVALSAPHPSCYMRASQNGEVYYSPHYRDQLVTADFGAPFDINLMTQWVADPSAKDELTAALLQSDVECLRNLYRANLTASSGRLVRIPPVRVPVLAMYGMADPFVGPGAYQESAAYVAANFKIVSIPGAGHFIHHEAAERVNLEIQTWQAQTVASL